MVEEICGLRVVVGRDGKLGKEVMHRREDDHVVHLVSSSTHYWLSVTETHVVILENVLDLRQIYLARKLDCVPSFTVIESGDEPSVFTGISLLWRLEIQSKKLFNACPRRVLVYVLVIRGVEG